MHEDNIRPTSGHAPRVTGGEDIATRRTDTKYGRMQPWQVMALLVAAVLVIGLVMFYI